MLMFDKIISIIHENSSDFSFSALFCLGSMQLTKEKGQQGQTDQQHCTPLKKTCFCFAVKNIRYIKIGLLCMLGIITPYVLLCKFKMIYALLCVQLCSKAIILMTIRWPVISYKFCKT